MRRERTKRLLLAAGSLALALAAAETSLRLFVSPSDRSYGRLLGRELPPIRVIPRTPPSRADLSGPYDDLVVGGRRIAKDDLYGILREDPRLGYAPAENAVSTNGWWRTNNIGARATRDTDRVAPPGRARVLVFGDSFACGSRVPQEAAWPSVLEVDDPTFDIVSLGVDGYGLGQSLLRYRALRDRVGAGTALLVFSPWADLWREINTIRFLGEAWESYTVMPRFALEGGRLELVQSPYDVPTRIYAENRDGLSEQLRDHLRRYDRFYEASLHEEPSPAARLVLVKLLETLIHERRVRRLRESLIDSDSEAMLVSLRIFETMRDEARAEGTRFVLVVLPSEVDLRIFGERGSYVDRWRAMVRSIRHDGIECVDLADEMRRAPAGGLDSGYDGSHYGPRANRLIARLVARALAPSGPISSKVP